MPRVTEPRATELALSGNLEHFPLEEVLRFLSTRKRTGTLQVKADGQKTSLEITGGELTAAHRPDDEGEIALAYIVDSQRGTFTFHSGATGPRELHGTLDELLERARAMATELAALRAEIPSDRTRVALSDRAKAGEQVTLSADALRVLLAVDGQRTVEDIFLHCGFGRFKTLQHLRHLLDEGLVEVTRRPKRVALRPAPETAFGAEHAPPDAIADRLDAGLAALAEGASTTAAAPAPIQEEGKEAGVEAAESRPASRDTTVFEFHYLPPGVAPTELDIERPPQRPPGLLDRLGLKRGGGDGRPAFLDVPPPARLAAFANELAAEFLRAAEVQEELTGENGALAFFSRSLASRLEGLYAAQPIGRRLPLRGDAVDVSALEGQDDRAGDVLPYLAMLVRELRDDAERAWGRDEGRQLYRSVVDRVFGNAPVPTPTQILRRTEPRVRGRLTVRLGGTGSFDLGPRAYVLGRSPSSDIVLHDTSVSTRHARLSPHLDGFVIADLGSTNGTVVNGERVAGERLLEGGEIIRLGEATLLYERVP